MAPGVLEVEPAFPRGNKKSGPVGLAQDGADPAATAYDSMIGDPLDREAPRWRCDVIDRDVGRWRLGGGGGENVGGEIHRRVLGKVGGIVGAPAKFLSFYGDGGLGVPSMKIGRKVEEE